MDAPGDISDEFDDDSLRASIEKADQQGQWRDSAAGFADPRLETIKKRLSEPERANYTERRLRDLQERAAAKAAAEAVPPEPTVFGDPFAGDWRETVVAPRVSPDDEPPPPSGPVTVIPEPSYLVADQSAHPVLSHLRPFLVGLWVFVPIGILQALLGGWQYEILLRTLAASGLAGFAWEKLDVDRFRAGIVGVAVHLLTFFVTASVWDAYSLIGNSAGFVIAMVGSIVVGSLRESRKLLADRRN